MSAAQTPLIEVENLAKTYDLGETRVLALQGVSKPEGNAFFCVASDSGKELYTRNGRLSMDGQGRLVHASSGFPVVNVNGVPPLSPSGSKSPPLTVISSG